MSLCINPSCSQPHNSDDSLFCESCRSELLLEGRYRVTQLRGRGGFGKTYEVRDRDGQPKILKVLTDNQPKHVELFQREAQLLNQLSHPGIPSADPDAYFTLYPKDQLEPLHCLVMEKIVGLDLRDYLQHRGKPIDQKLAIHWLTQLVEILQVIHQQHVLHRDIKPANIMLKADGYLALVDFGTARSVTHISGELGTRVVSSFYTPREQMQGQAVPQSDFFALGRTFVFLVTGQDLSTFYDAATDELHWRDAAADISAEFADFLDQLMHPLAGQRPANAEVILQRLTELEGLRHTKTTILLNRLEAPSSPVAPPVRSEHSQTAEETQRSVSSSLSSAESLRPEFVEQCERKLAEFIGPIATIVCQRTLAKMPQLSELEFVEQLAKKIPKLEAALEFQRYLGTHR